MQPITFAFSEDVVCSADLNLLFLADKYGIILFNSSPCILRQGAHSSVTELTGFVSWQQMTLIKAQAGVKNNVRRLNKSIVQYGSSNVIHVVLFALVCFFIVYMWSKMSRR